MKKYLLLIILLLPALYIANSTWHFLDFITTKITTTEKGFALVEAFTSEGCASCPPAYDVIEKIEKDAAVANTKVFILDYHVDHWDQMGWKDPYSEAAYSDRQRAYSKVIGPDYLYTPQMIVNGQDEFIGSQEKIAKKSIESALAKQADVEVKITIGSLKSGDSIPVHYEVSEMVENATLNFAITENEITNKVLAGENQGKTLVHKNVVRQFFTVPLTANNGLVKVPSLENYPGKGYKITCFIQNYNTLKILSAQAIDLDIKEKVY